MNSLRKLEGTFLQRAREAANEPPDTRAYYEGKQKERAWVYERVADELSAVTPKYERLEKDMGAMIVAVLQGDLVTAKEIAIGYQVEFPNGSPVVALSEVKS